MSEVKRFMFIKADADANNNKFWSAELHSDDSVFCRWGRVGANGQSKTFYGGQPYIDKKIKEKKKKGYREARVTANATVSTVASSSLKRVAKQQIKHSCPVVAQLIDFLVQVNAHQITSQSGGKLTVDVNSGQIQLPSGMGVLTDDAITDARDLINKIDSRKSGAKRKTKQFKDNVQDYLMLVPQVLGRNRGWIDTIFSNDQEIREQIDLLDSLEATLGAISKASPSVQIKEQVFDVKLAVVNDKNVRKHIEKLYSGTRKRMHQSYNLQPRTIYSVEISQLATAFEKGKKIGNIQELWHGTKASNLLSILKSGLIIPKSSGSIAVTGRMFGDGVYFSDQSTKALNYASGYWNGKRNNECFMFLADVAMGKAYTPKRWGGSLPKPGYDSTFAKGGQSGVSNNEMIVYKLNQLNLKYLVEFKR